MIFIHAEAHTIWVYLIKITYDLLTHVKTLNKNMENEGDSTMGFWQNKHKIMK